MRKLFRSWGFYFCFLMLSSSFYGVTIDVTSSSDDGSLGTLRYAINQVNASPGTYDTINCSLGGAKNITLTSPLPILQPGVGNSLTIIGSLSPFSPSTINGAASYRGLLVGSGNVSMRNFQFLNCKALGGAGGFSGGGGGAGLGGALFVYSGANVSIQDCSFSSNQAVGGAGDTNGLLNSGGGGGLGGPGGAGNQPPGLGEGGGGGGGGYFGAGGIGKFTVGGSNGNGGGGGGQFQNGSDGTFSSGGAGGSDGGGAGATYPGAGFAGSFGGGGGGGGSTFTGTALGTGGGDGGVFGGGGGASAGVTITPPDQPKAGDGGFGGGGGCSGNAGIIGGAGGFGGGGGGGFRFGGSPPVAPGGYGGGAGNSSGGGGGAGFGGAIFVMEGGSLTLQSADEFSGQSFTSNSVTAGSGVNSGTAAGSDLFLNSGFNFTFSQSSTLTISGSIAGDSLNAPGTFSVQSGKLILQGTNTFLANVSITNSVLQMASASALGDSSNPVTLNNNATLQFGANVTAPYSFTLGSTGTQTIDTQTFSPTIDHISVSCPLSKIGSGTLTLNEGISPTSLTVNEGSLALNGSLSTNALTLSSGAGTVTFSATATYTSATINGGTLQAGSVNVLSSSTPINLAASGARLNLNGYSNTISNVYGSGSILLGSATLTFGSDNNPQTLTGSISGTTGGIIKNGTATFTIQGPNSYSGVTQINAGTIQANAANAFASSSAVNLASDGTLDLNNFSNTIANAYGSGNITLGSGTLTLGGDNNSQALTGNITGTTGGIVKSGTGTFTVSGTNSYSGITQVNAGRFQANRVDTFSSNSVVSIASGATLDLNSFSNTIPNLFGTGNVTLGSGTLTFGGDNNSQILTGNITGSTGGIVKNGTGSFRVSGANSYSGVTQINAGTLQAGAVNAFASNSSVNIALGATLDLNNFSNTVANVSGAGTISFGSAALTLGGDNASQTFSGLITGSGGSLVKNGLGTFTLSGTSNTYSGGTVLNAGTVSAAVLGSLGSGAVTFAGNSTLQLGSSITLSNVVINNNVTASIDTGSNNCAVSSSLTGTGSGITKLGSGILTLSGTGNTYTGTTTISAGTVTLTNTGAMSPNSAVSLANVSGAVLNLNNLSVSVASLSGGGSSGGNVNLGTGSLTVGQAGSSTTFSGSLLGSASSTLTKVGLGTLTLDGTNTYGGGTNVNAGNITLGSANALGSGTVTFNGASGMSFNTSMTLDQPLIISGLYSVGLSATGSSAEVAINQPLTGTGGISNSATVTWNGGGTFTLGASPSYGTRTSLSNVTIKANGVNTLFSNCSNLISADSATTLNLNGYNNTVLQLQAFGPVQLGSGDLTFTSTALNRIGGSVSGSGRLILQSTGTVQLTSTATNTFTGGIVLNAAGTFTASLAGAPNYGTGPIVFNANGTVSGPINTSALNGQVQISDGVTGTLNLLNVMQPILNPNGTVTFRFSRISGSNTYAGNTLFSAGTTFATASNVLSANSNHTLSNVSGCILNLNNFSNVIGSLAGGGTTGGNVSLGSATLTLGNSTDTTYAGVISGTGGIIKQGSGKFTVTGTNTYTGGTQIAAGTVAISRVNQLSSGTVTFTGNSTLQMTSPLSFNLPVSVQSGVTASFDTAGVDSSLTSAITSTTGGIEKKGLGTLTLSATNTYTGATTVSAGTLSVNGRITSPVTVQSGATLKGTGTIANTVAVNAGGSIYPGNSIGTLTIDGSLSLDASATTEIEISPTANSLISVIGTPGTASLNGALSIVTNPGFYPEGTSYIILQATGGRSGTFSSVASDMAGLDFTVRYFSTYVELLIGSTVGFLSTEGLWGNSLALAEYFNQLPPDQLNVVAVNLGVLSQNQLSQALKKISPSRNSFSTFVAQNNAVSINQLLSHRMGQRRSLPLGECFYLSCPAKEPQISKKSSLANQELLSPKKPYTFWIDEIGSWSRQNAQYQNPSFTHFSNGTFIGVDFGQAGRHAGGLFVGFANAWIAEKHNFGHATLQQYLMGMYGTGYLGNAFLETSLWAGYDPIYNERKVNFPDFIQVAKAKWHAWQLVPHLKLGYDAVVAQKSQESRFVLEPYASLDWPIYFQNGYQEEGAGFYDMSIRSQTSSLMEFQLGLNGIQIWNFCSCSLFLKEGIGFIHRSPFDTGRVKGALLFNSNYFVVHSFMHDQNLGAGSLEIQVQSRNSFFGSLLFNAEMGSNYSSEELVAEIGFSF